MNMANILTKSQLIKRGSEGEKKLVWEVSVNRKCGRIIRLML